MCFQDYVVALGFAIGIGMCPLLFSIYSEPICDIEHNHGINIHAYMQMTQLYLSFEVSNDTSECLTKMEKCVGKIREWMRKNKLRIQ